MSKFDKIYKEIVETIDKKGIWSEGNVRTKYADGTPAHYKSYIGYQFRLDNSTDEAHLITTRFAPNKSPIRELYWIWIMQSNDVDVLNKLGCKFWDSWGIKELDNRELIYVKSKNMKKPLYKEIKVHDIVNLNAPIYHSKDFGDYYVLEYFKNEKGSEFKTIQFKNTGYIKDVGKYKTNPKDPYKATVYNLGYYGLCQKEELKDYFGSDLRKWIRKWESMVRRCTGNSNSQNWYTDVFLGEDFRSCEYFLEWVKHNNFWGRDKLNELDIDKDYFGSKCYSADTCVLIPHKANVCLTNYLWYKYDDLYFFSKTDLGKYVNKFKKINVHSGSNMNRIDLRKLDEFIKCELCAGNLEIIKNVKTDEGLLPRFKIIPKNTILHAYGSALKIKTFRYTSQFDYVLKELKNNPNSRRIMTEMWLPEHLDNMALNPCCHLTQWSVIGNKLYLEVRQRSCDVALGLVANVFQYSILHKLVAMECGLEPAEIIWNIHNVHIYDRHMPELLEQIKRPSIDGATVKIKNFKSIYEFKPDDIVVENYQYGDKISYEVAI